MCSPQQPSVSVQKCMTYFVEVSAQSVLLMIATLMESFIPDQAHFFALCLSAELKEPLGCGVKEM